MVIREIQKWFGLLGVSGVVLELHHWLSLSVSGDVFHHR
jgi:hypothetical protein